MKTMVVLVVRSLTLSNILNPVMPKEEVTPSAFVTIDFPATFLFVIAQVQYVMMY